MRRFLVLVLGALAAREIYHFFLLDIFQWDSFSLSESHFSASYRQSLQSRCDDLRAPAGPPPSFKVTSRVQKGSDRWIPGTPPILLKNGKIWTGKRNGTEVIHGDILLDRGLVLAVGHISPRVLSEVKTKGDLVVRDVGGKWVTPGLVDLHSHIGVYSIPELDGASDGNSPKGPIAPWVRSIDALNTHDASYELARAGGVTTAQILPGSGNNIGGQAFIIKLRDTEERSAISKVVEPPLTLIDRPNGTDYIPWRHMKHACGENPAGWYGETRMDGQWNFRNAYNEARKIRDAQDAFCQKVDAEDWSALQEEELFDIPYTDDLKWESLVDVLRGRVKLSIHCYEGVDLDGIVRLSNEFKFPVASFHHAGETYLVPDLLKKTWGGVPTIALFATNFRKKREAYRGSEFAPRVLSDHGIPVAMKSDHPVLNSRYLLFEAQQAHYYGLDAALALASVTSTPARAAGLGHRVGTIAEGYDADVVVWDSHPLTLGATPEQVYIDGIAQLSAPFLLKPRTSQRIPNTPEFGKERNETVKSEGVPPLHGVIRGGRVRVVGVRSLVLDGEGEGEDGEEVKNGFDDEGLHGAGRVVVFEGGKVICVENADERCDRLARARLTKLDSETSESEESHDEELVVDLKGGSISPGLTTYGSPLGLVEIRLEPSTNDGRVLDPLAKDLPVILKGSKQGGVVRAVDGLSFDGRNALTAYRSGVTTAITAPTGSGFLRGVSVAFSLGAPHAHARGAILRKDVALHISVSPGRSSSVSTQVEALRKSLLGDVGDCAKVLERSEPWGRVCYGDIPLVVSVDSADIMATFLEFKADFELVSGRKLKLTFSGAAEAHLLANEIAEAGVSVILTSPRAFPSSWDRRRILPGPPLSKKSSILTLFRAGVNVAIGVVNEGDARNTRLEVAWAALESNGTLRKEHAIAFASSNLHKALGYEWPRRKIVVPDYVLYSGGGVLDLESKVAGVVSGERRIVEVF